MRTPEPNSVHEDAAPREGAASPIAAFVAVARNLTIYPPAHPRVSAAAGEFVAQLVQHNVSATSLTLAMRGDDLLVDGKPAGCDARSASYLKKRLRECGLRSAEFKAGCAADDVVALASALNKFRARVGLTFFAEWKENASIVLLPLVFAGHHDASATNNGTPADGAGNDAAVGSQPAAPSPLRQVLGQLARSPIVRNCLSAIESHTQANPGEETLEVDLLASIEQLMPVDIAQDPRLIEEAVAQIMARIEDSLSDLVRKNAKVKGAELLRTALGIARKYFSTAAPASTQQAELPSGRPEDLAIVADLGLLQHELAQLPSATSLQLHAPANLGEPGDIGAGMLGILLHTFAGSENASVVAEAKRRIKGMLPGGRLQLGPLLDAYLAPTSTTSWQSRLRILDLLVETGQVALLRERGLVNAAFVSSTFPEGLAMAARVLGEDAQSASILREGLAKLASTLDHGGTVAAVKAGGLCDPTVVRALLAAGGPQAASLLAAVAATPSQADRQVLLDAVRACRLPEAETAVLRAFENSAKLPREYLPSLVSAVALRQFEPLRTANGALLRRYVQQVMGRLSHAAVLDAVQNLALVPGPETEALLVSLAEAGRFTRFSARARGLRRCARDVLAKVRKEGPA